MNFIDQVNRAMDYAKRGSEALKAGNYTAAIEDLTIALRTTPSSPDYLIKRSTAYQRQSPPDYARALSDAERAVLCATERGRHELVIQAQQRRAIALFGLERYGDAQLVFGVVKSMDPREKTLSIWEKKVSDRLAALPEGDPKRAVTETTLPASVPPPMSDLSVRSAAATAATATTGTSNTTPAANAQTPIDKIRHDWYQSNDSVVFTLMCKNVPKDHALVCIEERSFSVAIPMASGANYNISFNPLYDTIDPSQSSYKVMSTKLEITLRKAQPGRKWQGLGRELKGDTSVPSLASNTTAAPTPATAASAPSYPTSSRNGPKDWDKVAASLTRKSPASEGNSDGASTAAPSAMDDLTIDDDDDEGDSVNAFFKKLYAGASPETQRAMMKSYTESNGTALSTNWEEVSKEKVKVQPPEGMEEKKF